MNPDRWHPWTQFLPTPIVTNLATLGRVGYWGPAPGTNGTAAGVILYTVLFYFLSPFAYLLLGAGLIYLSIAICGEAEKRLFKRDPGEVILDEVAAVPVCFFGLHASIGDFGPWAWTILLTGFGLFRILDILKPLGIKQLQRLPGGLGVVVDDIAAGAVTCVCLHAIVYAIKPYLFPV